jgi:hypothetical protein
MTYVDDPVLGVVSVGPADVEPAAIAHRLYDSDVVAAVEMLRFSLGYAARHVRRLQVQGVSLATGLVDVAQIQPVDPIHCSDVKRISFAVHVESAVVQHPTRELSYMIFVYLFVFWFPRSRRQNCHQRNNKNLLVRRGHLLSRTITHTVLSENYPWGLFGEEPPRETQL